MKILLHNRLVHMILIGICFFPVLPILAEPVLPFANGQDVALTGAACMHGDPLSSDTASLPGPGVGDLSTRFHVFWAACPTILVRSDGNPFVLSTTMLGKDPVARLLDQKSGKELARLKLNKGSLLGGVYAYLDSEDQLVMVDGDQQLIRIKAQTINSANEWALSIDSGISLLSAVSDPCGGNGCDAVVSISPGASGAVWFATQKGVAGLYQPVPLEAGHLYSLRLGEDERIDNSFSTTPEGQAIIVTNKALYMLRQEEEGPPRIIWRQDYNQGTARKPGQLSHGSGATPTIFGPDTGAEYAMITDNADDGISLIVRDAEEGRLLCEKKIFTAGINSGTENSAIGIGNSVIVASTYGYPYPAVPEGAGDSVPKRAGFAGGMVRVDLIPCEGSDTPLCTDCEIVWENQVRSAAVPKLSTADGLIYTVERKSPSGKDNATLFDSYFFTVIDFETGNVLKEKVAGFGFLSDTLQMAGNFGPEGLFWQGTMTGVLRIAPKNSVSP